VRVGVGEGGKGEDKGEVMCLRQADGWDWCHSGDDEAEEAFVRDRGFGDGGEVSEPILLSLCHPPILAVMGAVDGHTAGSLLVSRKAPPGNLFAKKC